MKTLKWWQQAVFYQIYPRSFADGNGDGIGDFPGMLARLDHMVELGVDAIWLSPHYPSPFRDCGYDIADYTDVAPEYGSLDGFCRFLTAAHARGLRVIIDLVLNHTSDQHPWFQASRSSRTHPQRDWYVWRDGTPDGPPNNWVSIFGGSAWTYDEATGQYYYHAFLKEQPDLNWCHPDVKEAMWQVVRFWLDLGVDGFRLDAIGTIFEHPDLSNHQFPLTHKPIIDIGSLSGEEIRQILQFQIHQPGLHELMQELRTLVDTYPGERVLVGEDENVMFHGDGDNELHLVFNFPLMQTHALTPAHIRDNQALRLTDLPSGAWPCNTLGNHDVSRMWHRYGDGLHNDALARVHLALLLTLRGTPFLYYGEELGMTDLHFSALSDVRDTIALHQFRLLTEQAGVGYADALQHVLARTRDRCRTPMQWDRSRHAGFSQASSATWLPVHPNYLQGITVEDQKSDPQSMLSFCRQILALRRRTPALIAGDYRVLHPHSEHYLAFLRHDPLSGQLCLILLNFSAHVQELTLTCNRPEARLLFSSGSRSEPQLPLASVTLVPYEILIAELDPCAPYGSD
ncbi:glycoside hydrolase family 13 protein [Candidatus Chloroploca asiatica]|uniref:Glucohydrolase n=1 Tax=Candidatus Chloroploca asiatica TaxID=1506545 RepID=A0A2H3KY39_9CHLR|nr:alpha-glucosidase [Candidatus Chloroploca asiatica]PDV98901.1 glucohydrolase [Candidatus Chloroploca asiatica]